MSTPRAKYLPGIIPYSFALYFFIVLVIVVLYRSCCFPRKSRHKANSHRSHSPAAVISPSTDHVEVVKMDHSDQEQALGQVDGKSEEEEEESLLPSACLPREQYYLQDFFQGQSFEILYDMSPIFYSLYKNDINLHVIRRKQIMWILLIWRLACFVFFVGIAFLWGYINMKGYGAFYFTWWNVKLIALYYTLILIATGIGMYYDDAFLSWRQANNSANRSARSTAATRRI